MIRHSSNTSESWKSLNWKQFRKNLFRLQSRVFKAVRVGNKRKARFLQKLILKSKAARFLAIRQVTQLNAGKKTAGIDGKKSLDFSERFALEAILKINAENWKHSKLRSIPIPKKDGSTRMLKIPTIADRCWQCLAKYALEPAHEATFHAHSYGFRSGRSAHDAQQYIFTSLRSNAKGIDKRVIELDIEKCFDRISHTTIMDELIAPKGIKIGVFRCLKAGINPEFPEQGTPQGGVVSPLLANIALNGIESIHSYHKNGNKITDKTEDKLIIQPSVRYADDMVIMLRPQDDAGASTFGRNIIIWRHKRYYMVGLKKSICQNWMLPDDANVILEKIDEFLAARGMKVSAKKTKITAAIDGFDFLGWNFKVLNNEKYSCTPSVDNFKKFRQKVKAIVNNSNYGSKEKSQKLAPIVRGWRQYHKYCDMSGSRFSLWFLSHRAFTVFNKETKNTKTSATTLVEKAFPPVPYSIAAHIMVKGNKSPFDNDIVYWSERNSKLYDGATSKVLKRQNHTCGHCGIKLTSDERVHLHHTDGNHNNWKPNNLQAIHESCHDYLHMGKR